MPRYREPDWLSYDGLAAGLGGEEPGGRSLFSDEATIYGRVDPEVIHRMLDDGLAKDAFYLVKCAGMRQVDAARELGVSQPTVSRLVKAALAEYRALTGHGLCVESMPDTHGWVRRSPRIRNTFDLCWDGELDHDWDTRQTPGLAKARRQVRPLPADAKAEFDRKVRIAEHRYNPTGHGDGVSSRGADPTGLGPDEELLLYSGERGLFEDGADTPQPRRWPPPAAKWYRPNYRWVDGRQVEVPPILRYDPRLRRSVRLGTGQLDAGATYGSASGLEVEPP